MASPEPSPTGPLFLLSAMAGLAFLPWLKSYLSAVLTTFQEIRGRVFLWPLLIILGISLISTVCNWMNPVPAPSTTVGYPLRNREWKGTSNAEQQLQSEYGTGVGLFMFLVVALVLIPWR